VGGDALIGAVAGGDASEGSVVGDAKALGGGGNSIDGGGGGRAVWVLEFSMLVEAVDWARTAPELANPTHSAAMARNPLRVRMVMAP